MSKNVIIVGGHGNISLRLASLLSPKHTVTSIIRTDSHAKDIVSIPAKPVVLSLEESSVEEFARAFGGQDVVYFCAGAGGKGGDERTKSVDYEGAVKVFDAIEGVDGRKPRLVLLSSIDVRDPERVPKHYDERDVEISKKYREVLGTYVKWKYEADKELSKRTAFKWTMLRPGGLRDEPGTGKACVGKTHLTPGIPRADVAKALALLVDREDAAGLGIDIIGGEVPIEEGLDAFIKKGETDFLG
ncbi:NAD(P)-binding protein [Macrolepiota fuliginosa MF-IS2]|uniref:NAD(P)-binding protein n=1 Tax=Macrolepiota fuliginosa MF-IS2 TaxID=1400762 RepID=A0A9P5X336_9AGAR|nr:NAD(P)-binding protein [Macrolepiota fuliginosa MF-IS2]